jgi:hypothetical protein
MDERYTFAMYHGDEEHAVQLSYRAMNIVTGKAEELARRDELGKVVPIPGDLFSGPTSERIKEPTDTIGFRWFGTGREFRLSLASQAEIMDLINSHTANEDELEAEFDEAR